VLLVTFEVQKFRRNDGAASEISVSIPSTCLLTNIGIGIEYSAKEEQMPSPSPLFPFQGVETRNGNGNSESKLVESHSTILSSRARKRESRWRG
jgi:hypothetical protein